MNLLVIILFYHVSISTSLIIDGEFLTDSFYQFVSKFGFQFGHQLNSSYGYVYGNFSGEFPNDAHITFAVLDRHHFLEFYGNR